MKTQCPQCSASFDPLAGVDREQSLVGEADCPVCGFKVHYQFHESSLPDFELGQDLAADFTMGTRATPESGDEADDDPFALEVGFLDDLMPDEEEEEEDDPLPAPLARPAFAMGAGPAPADEPAVSLDDPPAPARAPIAPPSPPRDTDDDFAGEDSLGFVRKGSAEISGLTEMDLSMVGSYSRSSRGLDNGADVVWSGPKRKPSGLRSEEPSAEAPRRDERAGGRPSRAPADDVAAPAGRAARAPVDLESPFGSGARTAPNSSDPFADLADPPPRKPSRAPDPKAERDPFSDAGGLFGGDDELFGGSAPQPSPASAPSTSSRRTAPPADDLFAAPSDRGAKRAGGGVDDLDFAGLHDEPGARLDEGPRPAAAKSDTSRRKSAVADDAQLDDPFSPREDTNTFFIEAPSMSGFTEGPSAVPEAGAGAAPFELDMPGPKGGKASSRAAVAPGKGGKAPLGRAPKGKKSRGAPLPSKPARGKGVKVGRGQTILALVLVLLIVAGVGAELAGFGWFGMNLIDGGPTKPKGPPPGPHKARTVAVAASPAISDTSTAYREQIDALEKQASAAPSDDGAKQKLVALYLEYSNRFPAAFASDDKYVKRLAELSKQVGVASNPRLHALDLIRSGELEGAKAALDEAVASAAADPDILFAYGQIEFKKGNTAKAIEYFDKATDLLPDFVKAWYYKGKVHEQDNRLDEALAAYGVALEKNPAHAQSRLGIVRIQLANKQVDEAIKNASDVLAAAQREGNTEDQFQAHVALAQAHARQNDSDQRIKHLEAASQIKGDDEVTALELADLYIRTGRLDKGEEMLLGCHKRGCASPRFYSLIVGFYTEQRRSTEEAEKFAAEGVEKLPDDPQVLFLQATVADSRKLRKNARAAYEAVIEKDPGFVEAYSRLAAIFADEGRHDQATRILEQGIQNVPSSTPLLAQLAEMMSATGQRVKAKDVYKQLVAKDPSNAPIRLQLANLLRELGYVQEALEQYEVLLSQGSMDAPTTLAYAETLAKANQHKKAIDELERLVQADPQDVQANARLGALYVDIQSYRTARKYLELTLKLNPGFAPAFYQLGRMALAQSDPDQAIAQLQKAVSADPSALDYRQELAKALVAKGGSTNKRLALQQYGAIIKEYDGLAASSQRVRDPAVYLGRGDLLFESGQYRDAMVDFEKAMLMDSGRLDSVAAYAETLFKVKKVREAESYFREILGKDSGHVSANYYMGRIALQRGQRQKAMEHLNASVRSGGADFPDAHKTLGFMYREKNMTALARREFEAYLKTADASAFDREEIERLLNRLR